MAPDDARSPELQELIFDIGMNVCEDTDFYLKKGFRVVAVEANPATCRAAAEKYAEAIAAGRLTILNRAISNHRGPVMLYLCRSNSALSTASPKLRDFWRAHGDTFEEIEVPGILARDLIVAHGTPYYAKIDIEGSDILCLDAFTKDAPKPRYLSFEVDFCRYRELLARLRELGYRRFALIGQSGVVGQRPPYPPCEGRYIDYRFDIGSSGLFGRELPERWRDEARIRRRCRRVIRQYRLAGVMDRAGELGLMPHQMGRARQIPAPRARLVRHPRHARMIDHGTV
jgi:FkbM family methyltransferase